MSPLVNEFPGEVVVIAGGAQGIGRAITRMFSENGAKVAFLDLKEDPGKALEQELREQGREALFLPCNMTKGDEVRQSMQTALDHFGQIDVLVNVAGGSKLVNIWDMTEENWDEIVNLNLRAVFLTNRAVIPHMMERKKGVIINIASGQASYPAPQRSNYSAAKAGVIAFGRTIALELIKHGIRVNTVAPGATATERAKSFFDEAGWAENLAKQPMGRAAEPEDIANAVLFMASPRARHITGQLLHVNGGNFMP